jgi:spermidine synthase
MNSWRLKSVVALSGAVLMSLEILGSRVLAPAYGSSVYVWGGLITTFLVALAVGYAVGGRLADARPTTANLSMILAAAAALVLPAVVWAPELLRRLGSAGWDVRWSALVAALILFLPPSLAMGMVSPFAVRLAIRGADRAGSVAGGYSALSTAGSIVGTLATAFVLIPILPVHVLLLALAGTLAVCAVLLVGGRASALASGGAVLACALAGFTQGPPASIGGEKVLLRKDTPYHHIAVTEMDSTRYLRFDNLRQGAVNLADPGRSVLNFEQAFFLPFAVRPGIRRICMIGLGGGVFPREISSVAPDVTIETVEIDPAVRDIAKKFFLYSEGPRVRTTIEDGRVFLARPGPLYDLVILDAFNATGVPFHLTTREFFEAVRRRTAPDGAFVANYIGSLMGRGARLFWASYATIRRQYGQVYVSSPEIAAGSRTPRGNIFLLATMSSDPVPLDRIREQAAALGKQWRVPRLADFAESLLHSPDPPDGTPELTDAYAPVEALQNF